jgi:methylmalonyl-CoA/ethylmalonyl-CoA epimerase
LITGFNHVSIVVSDLDAAIVKIGKLFGLRTGQPELNEAQGVRIAYVDLGNARIELMEPSRPDSPVAKFLERNPNGGIHHFCLNVDDVADTAAALSANGVRVLGDGREQRDVHGQRIAFIHPQDFLGALVEMEEHRSR